MMSDTEGSWFIYKLFSGELDVVFIHWTTEKEFEKQRILSRSFECFDEAHAFLVEFLRIWWRMSHT